MARRMVVTMALVLAVLGVTSPAGAAGAAVAAFEPVSAFGPGLSLVGHDLNDAGMVVGSAEVEPGTSRAFARDPDGTLTDLGALGTGTASTAEAVSDDGTVVGGSATTPVGNWRAFRWTEGGGMVDLGTLPGDFESHAADVNTEGWIVGSSSGPTGIRGWVRDPGTGVFTAVGPLPGGSDLWLTGINGAGVAIGETDVAGAIVPVVWTEADGLTRLSVSVGFPDFAPQAINDAGLVVGTSYNSDEPNDRSFVHDLATGSTSELGGFTDSVVVDIDERGYAVGVGADPSTPTSLVVWDTVAGRSWRLALPVDAGAPVAMVAIGAGGQLLATASVGEARATYLGQLVVPPSPVTDLGFADTNCVAVPTLSWSPPAFDGYGTVRYRVSSGGNVLAEITATTYSDPRVADGEINVLAFNEAGESLPSSSMVVVDCLPPQSPPPVVVQPRFTG